ncbi:hypothetical protein [Paraflavitalea sp. CAU 1676]|uniref:hypothetical protein n=1 Tax=Paraflavitalea sp. CAU 1676 TaxID=3032598 RepID=UPI0023DACED7|nr:hypothetical protein [Paraflavitalea sp. CAU 1676]MDF2190159.1 hypothetical protein [Paraflavitalea sp. CAU 1676]
MMPSMLLVSLYEFRQFIQIVLWIAVPATVIAVGLTIFFHYRRKKKQGSLELAFQDDQAWSENLLQNPAAAVMIHSTVNEQPDAMPDWLASANPDNTPLLKKYEQEVRRYRENYAILEQDFRELEGRYADLRNKAYQTDKEEDRTLVAQLQKDIKSYQEKIHKLQETAVENNVAAGDMAAGNHAETILLLQQELQQFQEENDRLQRLLVAANTAGNDQHPDERLQALQHLLQQADAERKALKDKLAEQEYLPDMLEEKRKQIEYLQQQLEQRIKNYHLLEHQSAESAVQLKDLQVAAKTFEGQIQQLNRELEAQRQQSGEWQSALEQSRTEGQQKQETIQASATQISELENSVRTLQESQVSLQAEIDGQQAAMFTLRDNLAQEQQKANALESRLETSSQLLMRIYGELTRSIDPHLIEDTVINTEHDHEEHEPVHAANHQLQTSL